MKRFVPKRASNNRVLINLGCGQRMHPEWNNVDFSVHARLRHFPTVAKLLHRSAIISDERFSAICNIDSNIIVWDLRKGIPFDDKTFDVVYHSHLLEHIDREESLSFLTECYCVLKLGGVIRVVVPDLERLAKNYISSLQELDLSGPDLSRRHWHELTTENLFEQMVRKEPAMRKYQRPIVRFLERRILGYARQTGEVHRWMYDRYSLRFLLEKSGFRSIQQVDAFTSQITDWEQFGLDVNTDGSEYKLGSLYFEAKRPL